MENKEVEKSLNNIREGIFSEEDIQHIREYIEQLEFNIEELHWCINHNEKSHLFFTNNQVKIIENLEKALDKACVELEKFDMTLNNADFDDVRDKIEWKEWCVSNE